MSASSPVSIAAPRAPLATVLDEQLSRVHPYLLRLGAFGVGALVACSFAPLQWWLLAILGPAALMFLWDAASPRAAAWLGFWFNFGTFFVGTIWLYTGLHVMGGAPAWMA
ncbi:MAG TPA: hypothetical protein VG994_07810, partial [Steroidobacteraceae bacterium]|nr:hypothetical protein [Steroidobacteraceae bacterium]